MGMGARRRNNHNHEEEDLKDVEEEAPAATTKTNGHHHRKNVWQSDGSAIVLLLILYTLQGIPMGLSGAIPLLVAGRANYKQQALFSLASLPFSLKLLWAPIVDSTRFSALGGAFSAGLRKSWLVPTQTLIGVAMILSQSSIDEWMARTDIAKLTVLFSGLYLLCATQDVAVDGWALTILSAKNVGWGPTCNSLGQSLGYALSYVGFVALHESGRVSLSGFVGACGWAFLLTTLAVAVGPFADDQRPSNFLVAYKRAFQTLRLSPVKKLCVVLLTCKAAFGAADAATSIKAVEYGLPREQLALLSPVLLIASVVFPLACARWTTGPRPLDAFVAAVPLRLFCNLATWAVLEYMKSHEDYRFLLFASLSLFREFASNLMFVAQMAFFATVSDPDFGGTYMTLLNTVANLGGRWPPSLALYLLDPIATLFPKENAPGDPFGFELVLSTLVGCAWLVFFRGRINALQALPLKMWRIASSPSSSS